MASAARKRREVFPSQPPKKKQKGVRKPVVTLRVPRDIEVYLDATVRERGVFKTEAIIKCVRIARDVAEGLGAAWWEVERRASVAGTTPGAVLAQLASAGLNAEDPSTAPKK